mgnify:CR=1 FL=1
MTNDADSDDKPPGRSSRGVNDRYESTSKLAERDRVLAPLLKSLGWELVGVGAEFPDDTNSRKSSGWMRNLFGRQAATGSLVGSSPTASAQRIRLVERDGYVEDKQFRSACRRVAGS